MHDLAIVITSLNEAHWLRPCLTSLFEHADGADFQVVVVDIESTDDTLAMLGREFPGTLTVTTTNLGFSHANNRGYLLTDARYVLFLNPDTEWVEGSLARAIRAMDSRPEVGIAGCRQLTSAGVVYPTMRRFRTPLRAVAEALGAERLAPRLGQRILEMELYDREIAPDWVIGSFMLTRREALLSAGCFDERYFLYSEEEDFCRRVRAAGWDIRHLPELTIVHHVGKAGTVPKLEAQRAYAMLQLGARHQRLLGRVVMRTSLMLGYGVRLGRSVMRRDRQVARAQARGLRVALGVDRAPFVAPPPTGLSAEALAEVQRREQGGG